jgi:hypothetical protein
MIRSARTTPADTLVGSLCREIWDLRHRARQVQDALQRCQHPGLGQRLCQELQTLAQRRAGLQRLADQLAGSRALRSESSVGVALLVELCRRPLLRPG